MFAMNFVIYLATSHRIRQAYSRFIKDMWRKICKKSEENQENAEMETSVWWIGLRNLQYDKASHDLAAGNDQDVRFEENSFDKNWNPIRVAVADDIYGQFHDIDLTEIAKDKANIERIQVERDALKRKLEKRFQPFKGPGMNSMMLKRRSEN